MSYLIVLVPVALFMGTVGLVAFFWSLRNAQYEDLDGAAVRILLEDDEEEEGMAHADLTVAGTATPNHDARRRGGAR